jgi:hypothetical protein
MGIGRGRGGLAPKTICNPNGAPRAALRDAVRWGCVARNVAAAAHLRRGWRRRCVSGAWSDIDLDAGRVSPRPARSRTTRSWVSEPKTAKGRRSSALDPATAAALRDHRHGSSRPGWPSARAGRTRGWWAVPEGPWAFSSRPQQTVSSSWRPAQHLPAIRLGDALRALPVRSIARSRASLRRLPRSASTGHVSPALTCIEADLSSRATAA